MEFCSKSNIGLNQFFLLLRANELITRTNSAFENLNVRSGRAHSLYI